MKQCVATDIYDDAQTLRCSTSNGEFLLRTAKMSRDLILHPGPFLDREIIDTLGDCAQHTEPIRATKGSLESQIQGLQNDTTITGNGLDYFEM